MVYFDELGHFFIRLSTSRRDLIRLSSGGVLLELVFLWAFLILFIQML